jgi:hypothetical protein
LSSVAERLVSIGESVPGWTLIALLLALVTLLIGGRILDLTETVARGVETAVRNATVVVNESTVSLGDYMPDYGYRDLARAAWATLTSLLAGALTLFAVSKVVTAIVKRGEVD